MLHQLMETLTHTMSQGFPRPLLLLPLIKIEKLLVRWPCLSLLKSKSASRELFDYIAAAPCVAWAPFFVPQPRAVRFNRPPSTLSPSLVRIEREDTHTLNALFSRRHSPLSSPRKTLSLSPLVCCALVHCVFARRGSYLY
jgi:hypothetical protein